MAMFVRVLNVHTCVTKKARCPTFWLHFLPRGSDAAGEARTGLPARWLPRPRRELRSRSRTTARRAPPSLVVVLEEVVDVLVLVDARRPGIGKGPDRPPHGYFPQPYESRHHYIAWAARRQWQGYNISRNRAGCRRGAVWRSTVAGACLRYCTRCPRSDYD